MAPHVQQINVKPDIQGEVGLPKMPINTANVTFSGIDGDYNRFRKKKKDNDPDMAIMIISTDILFELNQEGWPVQPGDLGENLTLSGMDYGSIKPGQQYKIGDVILEISFICDPCSNLYALPYVGEDRGPEFIKTLMNRRGWYARVLTRGIMKPGDGVALLK
ncbi:MAG: MOSC domain-containing protein [Candidatus Marinimicrobia bacterium]|nr:MOSC domain-containing protein [Candidatus Neomarinimicrobiota bacterium]MDD9888588.1 MOSC domain-containing protein [Candidatus Neomarinimicrobiota bacterium]MDD9930896.1 MOSC domain-containing protein [Candidatus Neomarinimicrobiota bacterium]